MLEYCIVNWTLGNMLQWNFSWNWYIFIKNAFEIVFRKLAAILSRRQCVKNVFLHSNCNREITTNGWTCYNPSVLLYCKCSSLLVPRIIECILNHRKICCPLFYVDVISYACPNFNAVSVNILVKEATDSKRNHKGISFFPVMVPCILGVIHQVGDSKDLGGQTRNIHYRLLAVICQIFFRKIASGKFYLQYKIKWKKVG